MPDQTQPQIEAIIQASVSDDTPNHFDKQLAISESKHKFKDQERAASYKHHLHIIVVIGMYAIGLIIISLILIRAWHLATNVPLQWLTDSQLHSIDAVLFSSIIFSLASKYFSYYRLFQRNNH